MKSETLKIGHKFGTEHVQVACVVRIPETPAECRELAKSDEFMVQMFVRGWRIWNQEQSGARDFVAASTVQQRKAEDFATKVQAVVDAADPSAPPKRAGRPAQPQNVEVTPEMSKAMKKGDMASFQALLAAQGVKVNLKVTE